MKTAPSRYRMITPQLTISAPLQHTDVGFLHDAGCRKIYTLSGGFVSSEVVPRLKQFKMECTHYPLDILSSSVVSFDQLEKITTQIVKEIEAGSNVHIVSGYEMAEAACVVGQVRRLCSDWTVLSAVAEALDICRFAEPEFVLRHVMQSSTSDHFSSK